MMLLCRAGSLEPMVFLPSSLGCSCDPSWPICGMLVIWFYINYFTKYLTKSNLRKECLFWLTVQRTSVHHGQEGIESRAWGSGSHLAYSQKAWRDDAQLFLHFLFFFSLFHSECQVTHSGWFFPPRLHLSGNSLYAQRCVSSVNPNPVGSEN